MKSSDRDRVIAEENTFVQTSSPFVCKMHHVVEDENVICFILEYCEGGDLEQQLSSYVSYPHEQIRIYLAEIVLALEHLHSLKVLFRDLKPTNILVDRDGHLKITDFGLAKDMTDERPDHSFGGTYEFLAPEAITTFTYSYASDWWALGVVAFLLVTGYLPFNNENLSRLHHVITVRDVRFPKTMDAPTKELIAGLLKKNPDERFALEEVKNHEFFQGLDWDKVMRKEYRIPVRPNLTQYLHRPSW